MNIKSRILFLTILLTVATGTLAQEAARKKRITIDAYRVSFQLPDDASKWPESTAEQTIFTGDQTKFGAKARLLFVVNEQKEAEAMSQRISTDEGVANFAESVTQELRQGNPKIPMTILEKKRLQMAGLNAVKVVTSYGAPGGKVRSAMYVVPVPEQRRMYSFIIIADDDFFDKWLAATETAVNSFELLKTDSK